MRNVQLAGGQVAVVDNADYSKVSVYAWHVLRRKRMLYVVTCVYVPSTKKQKTVFMHRVILDAKPGERIEHVDGNGLNNQRLNLRDGTHSTNQAHRRANVGKRFKGATFSTRDAVWQARIKVDGQLINLGNYRREEDAARAYNEAAVLFFGRYARLNAIPPSALALT